LICLVIFIIWFLYVLYLYFVLEVEDVLPNSGEFFDAPNLVSSLKREDIALGNCSGFLEPYKLEPDTQEMGSYKKGTSQTFSRIKYIW